MKKLLFLLVLASSSSFSSGSICPHNIKLARAIDLFKMAQREMPQKLHFIFDKIGKYPGEKDDADNEI